MLNNKEISNGIIRAVLILGAITLGLLLLYKISTLFVYIALAFVVALISTPFVNFLHKKCKLKRTPAIAFVMLAWISFFVGFSFMFVPLFTTQARNLSVLNTSHLQSDFTGLIEKLDHFLDDKGFSLDKIIEESHVKSQLNFEFVPNVVNSFIGVLSDIGIGLFAVLFLVFFFLKDQSLLEYQFRKLFPKKHEHQVFNSVVKINNLLSRYFLGLCIQVFIIYVLSLILLLSFGVNGAVMIAFICAVLNIIPYIGPLVGNFLAVVFTMLTYIGEDFVGVTIPKALYVMIGFLIIQLIDNVVNQPLIFSSSVKSHPLEIFIVTLASGMFAGIFGMIAAIPIYTCLKVIGKEFFPNVRFIQSLTKNI